jgi:hypothetical protein
MYLTLPLPVQRFWEHTINWVPYDITKPHLKVQWLERVFYLHANLPQDSGSTATRWMRQGPEATYEEMVGNTCRERQSNSRALPFFLGLIVI